jgi:DNA-binding transcriptional LysR family regulator
MELKWLEDYLTLVETGNFTTAAHLRHVSQPAFSRRIQALESWLGVVLVDRRKKPFQFTAAAKEHETMLRNLVNEIYQARNQIKFSLRTPLRLSVAAQHSLLVTSFLPQFLEQLAASVESLNYSLVSENMDTCVAMFLKADVDVLVIYETQANRDVILPQLSVRKVLAADEMVLVVAPGVFQEVQRSQGSKTLPLLTYPVASFFGGVIWADVLPKILRHHNAWIACESSFSVGLREMALASAGAAWLPRSMVQSDIQCGQLLVLNDISPPIPMQVVAHLSRISEGQAAQQLRGIFQGDAVSAL